MRSLLLVVVVMVGCGPARLPGAPVVGAACGDSVPECSSSATVSICESGAWADYDCPSVCSNNQVKRCDWSQAKVGQACPASFEGVGGVACNADASAYIGCRGGVFAEVPCPNCRRGGAGLICG